MAEITLGIGLICIVLLADLFISKIDWRDSDFPDLRMGVLVAIGTGWHGIADRRDRNADRDVRPAVSFADPLVAGS